MGSKACSLHCVWDGAEMRGLAHPQQTLHAQQRWPRPQRCLWHTRSSGQGNSSGHRCPTVQAQPVTRRRRPRPLQPPVAALSVDDLPKSSTPLPAFNRTSSPDSQAAQAPAYVAPPPSEWHRDPVLMSGCEPQAAPLNVAVLLSGGVDSSLALRLLVAAGHKCTAFYLQIWFQEDFRNFWDACPWEEDLEYAQKVCDSLGVPLEVVPMTSVYWDKVVSSSVDEIRQGRTPNPDVLCNSRVKFGAFIDHLTHLETSGGQRFDRVASGHYARVVRGVEGSEGASGGGGAHAPHAAGLAAAAASTEARLCLTPDAVKDQTYFLAQLSAAQLSRAMFPIGALTKAQVRALAAAAGLATQSRPDSQGICFLGKVKFSEFVKEHLGEWRGLIVEEDTHTDTHTDTQPGQGQGSEGGSTRRGEKAGGGNGGRAPTAARFGGRRVLGVHEGYWFYTVGQRGGIKLPGGPWYVVRKDCDLNIVYVSRRYYEPGRRRDAFVSGPLSWLSSARPDPHTPLLCKVRHGPHAYQCQVHTITLNPTSERTGAAGSKGSSQASNGHDASSSRNGTTNRNDSEETIVGASNGVAGSWVIGEPLWDQGVMVVLDGSDQGLAAGQYAVFYQGGVCLGCAQIRGPADPGVSVYSAPGAMGQAGVLTSEGLASVTASKSGQTVAAV